MARPRAICSLAAALRYRNRDVVDAFVDRYRVSAAEGAAVFEDMKRWLWLAARPDAPRLDITTELLIIDEMWHTFVLHSQAYTDYCRSRFGFYLHHLPTSRREKQRTAGGRERDPAGFARRVRRQRQAQYSFIADHLGEDTLLRWYADYPVRYGQAFFARLGIEVEPLEPAVAAELAALAAPH